MLYQVERLKTGILCSVRREVTSEDSGSGIFWSRKSQPSQLSQLTESRGQTPQIPWTGEPARAWCEHSRPPRQETPPGRALPQPQACPAAVGQPSPGRGKGCSWPHILSPRAKQGNPFSAPFVRSKHETPGGRQTAERSLPPAPLAHTYPHPNCRP